MGVLMIIGVLEFQLERRQQFVQSFLTNVFFSCEKVTKAKGSIVPVK